MAPFFLPLLIIFIDYVGQCSLLSFLVNLVFPINIFSFSLSFLFISISAHC